jgi:hypothetical protein
MAEPSRRAATQRFGAGRIVMVVAGALVALLGLGLLGGGALLVWAHTTQRDAAGYYTTSTEHFDTPTYALTSRVDLGRTPEDDWIFDHPVGTVRIRATSETQVFVGIGRQTDVDRWLAGVAHEMVEGADFGPFDTESTVVTGDRPPGSPFDQGFWTASVSGAGPQTLRWPSEPGRWTIVVMNADATAGVTADVDAGARTAVLLPIGLGFAALSLLLLAGSTALMFFGLRHHVGATPEAAAAPGPVAPAGTYPARLDGHLDPNLSRWLWLVKWFLLIPHAIVLGFLWLAVTMLTMVAGVSILFTGRYPRSIFDFNLGVMRWTWRVSFYAISAFGTDRYPPFSLRPEPDYPATFTVDYPEHLSRGLVLVKWWLLALPHYLVVAVFAGGWGIGWMGSWRIAGGSGLIAVLALIAVVVLAIRGRYPESIFDFVMGMNRWCYRVLVYAALMRDEYPPFHLDTGGIDPGSVPATPIPGPPDRSGDLVGSSK